MESTGGTAPPLVAVTGAAGAIGRSVVSELAERGSSVLALDLDGEALAALAGEQVAVAQCDTSDLDALRQACEAAEQKRGPLRGMFANAGVLGPTKPVREVTEQDLLDTYRVNVAGVFAGSRVAIELMSAHGEGGRILNMASGSGIRGTANMSVYVSSKHAVVGLTRCAALEVARDGIAVNALCPGCIDTPMMQAVEEGLGQAEAAIAESIPIGRYATTAEIAAAAAWLLLDAPIYVTGTTVPIDGGWAAT
jgi:NAD(P)-dependent dehydrogenase (short-subunit alcohol dehydrogenase family)